MTPEERDAVRKLLVRYEAVLSLAEDLALTLLEVLQPGAEPLSPDVARERRRSTGDALAMVEAGDAYASNTWKELDLERRQAPQGIPPRLSVEKERRRPPRRRRRS